MVMQTIEHAPIDDRFVVRQSDLDMFDSLDDLFMPSESSTSESASSESLPVSPKKNKKSSKSSKKKKDKLRHHQSMMMRSFSSLPEDSEDHQALENNMMQSSSSLFLNSSSRRSSVSSNTSSNSSVCSKSFGFNDGDGDESIVSYGDESSSSQASDCLSSPRSHRSSSSRKHSKRYTTGKPSSIKAAKKSVHFTSSVTVRSIPDLDDFTQEERSQVWYNEQELVQIKQEAQDLIEQVKERKLSHTVDELRGLHMTQKRQRRAAWVMARSCVLDEQKRQARHQHGNGSDPETIARMYRSFAFAATQIAQKIGLDDALAAAKTYC
jgi:hypothetical protein